MYCGAEGQTLPRLLISFDTHKYLYVFHSFLFLSSPLSPSNSLPFPPCVLFILIHSPTWHPTPQLPAAPPASNTRAKPRASSSKLAMVRIYPRL